MRIPYLGLFFIVLLNFGADWYIYKFLRKECKSSIPSKIQLWSAATFALGLIFIFFLPVKELSDSGLRRLMWFIFVYISVYVPKYIFVIFDLIGRIPRLWHKNALKPVTWTGVVIAAIIFLALWWGALFNRYNIDVKKVDVEVSNLPSAFEGLRIVQISDMHLGTYGDDTSFIEKVVNEINSLKPDLVVFTGDIVNRRTTELEPFVQTLSQLRSTLGIYSVLGNHDYGDYYEWPDSAAQKANNEHLAALQQKMGWHLLRNEHVDLVSNGDTLVLIGVENIGDPPFHVYGNLSAAYPTPTDDKVKILLSHNPSHWVQEVADSKNKMALTLSGHTHAMQMTLFGWSPSSFRYPTWGGLYADNTGQNQLYVNIGTGTVGFPARIGATPEITLITLYAKN